MALPWQDRGVKGRVVEYARHALNDKACEAACNDWTILAMIDEQHAVNANQADQPGVNLQSIYFNGFMLGLSNSDVNATLLLDGQPVTRLHLSYTTAKTLHVKLKEVMEKLEDATQQNIMTTEGVEAGLRYIIGERIER